MPMTLAGPDISNDVARIGRPEIPKQVKVAMGRRLRELREALGWSQSQLADASGFASGNVITNMESGRRGFSTTDTLDRLAFGLETTGGRLQEYLGGYVPLDEMLAEVNATNARPADAWDLVTLRTNDAKPALHFLYTHKVDPNFIRAFIHRVNFVGGQMLPLSWGRMARDCLLRWNRLSPEEREVSVEDWLRGRRGGMGIDKEMAETMRRAYRNGMPSIEGWDAVYHRLSVLRSQARRARKKSDPDVTADELLEMYQATG